jgi:DUF971 family protein
MPRQSPPAPDPKSVRVEKTAGTGVDIDWSDGHVSHYSFQFLRDACPCALCEDERGKTGLEPGHAPGSKPGELPMFRPAVKPTEVEQVGRYALRFTWSDGHETGIYSWDYLRDVCPCQECRARRAMQSETSGGVKQ